MHTNNDINVIDNDTINKLRSSVSDIRDHLYIRDLKNDLKEFVNKNIVLEESQSFLKTEIINDVPSWFPKANLSRSQTDLIAISPEGEKIEFIDYFTNYDLPSIQTENDLIFKGESRFQKARRLAQKVDCTILQNEANNDLPEAGGNK